MLIPFMILSYLLRHIICNLLLNMTKLQRYEYLQKQSL